MFGLRGYVHLAGSSQAPKNSEYEMCMAGVSAFLAVKNAEIFDGSILRVIDEEKPVYVIDFSVHDSELWKLDAHLTMKGKGSGNFDAKPLLSSEAGAMIFSQVEHHKPQFVKIRICDEEYVAGDTSSMSGTLKIISFEDILDFCSGELLWEGLKGRSYLQEKKQRKELSSQEKNRELAEDVALKQEYINTLEQLKASSENDYDKLSKMFVKVPYFVRKFFSAV